MEREAHSFQGRARLEERSVLLLDRNKYYINTDCNAFAHYPGRIGDSRYHVRVRTETSTPGLSFPNYQILVQSSDGISKIGGASIVARVLNHELGEVPRDGY
jgi:hypothetical protein